jgi:hypothetical protein
MRCTIPDHSAPREAESATPFNIEDPPMTDDDFCDYLGASINGKGHVSSGYSMLGATDYANRQGSQQVGGGGGYSGPAGPGAFDGAADFAMEWSGMVVEAVAAKFTWVPNWVGRVLQVLGVCAFTMCGVHLGFTGLVLLGIAVPGWFAPQIVKFLFVSELCVVLHLLYVGFMAVLFVLGLGVLAGILYLAIRLSSS